MNFITNLNHDAAMRKTHGYETNCSQQVTSEGLKLTRTDNSKPMGVAALNGANTPERGCIVGVRYVPTTASLKFEYEGRSVGLKESGDGYRLGTVWNANTSLGVASSTRFDADEVTITGAFLMTPDDYQHCVDNNIDPFFSYATMPISIS